MLASWGGPVDAVGSSVDVIFALVFGAVVASAQATQVGDEGGSAEGPVEVVVVVAAPGGSAAAGGAAGAVAGVDERGLGGGGPVAQAAFGDQVGVGVGDIEAPLGVFGHLLCGLAGDVGQDGAEAFNLAGFFGQHGQGGQVQVQVDGGLADGGGGGGAGRGGVHPG